MRVRLLLILLFAMSSLVATAEDDVGELRAAYRQLVLQYAKQLSRPPNPEHGELLFVVEDQYAPVDVERREPTPTQVEYADALFALAGRAAEAGEPSLAFQWATEVVHENANHADARRVLGYELVDGQWLTAFAQRMHRQEKVWHRRFGWIDAADVARYERGERPAGRHWISAEDDALRHRHIDDGWTVRTDHFLVTTNDSIAAGVDLAARLERLHQVWRRQFAAFYLSDRDVRQLFAGSRAARGRSRPFQVIYHRDRDEYVQALRQRQPQIEMTLGIYFDTDREAHFFAEDGETAEPSRDYGTLYHETVHQLFQESRRAARNIGGSANFWVIEGVATYFESLQEHCDPAAGCYFTIGQPDGGRLPAARQRALSDGFYVPLRELTRLGKLDVQHHAEIAKLYSQSAGLATFLMQAEGGRYREPLVRYLMAVYAGRDKPDTLADVCGAAYPELDAQYRRYLQSLP